MRRNGRKCAYGSVEWVKSPEDGYFALLIAVIEQARADAAICPDALPIRHRSMANYDKAHAAWFLRGTEKILA